MLRGAAALLVLGTSLPAAAFCRTTTCDPNGIACEYDENGCEITGKPLAWRSSCVSYGVQQDGSPLRDISYDQAHSVIDEAFGRWTSTECSGGGNPSIEVADFGPIQCNEPQYNTSAANANVWMFHDSDWPYTDRPIGGGPVDNSDLAVTAVTYNPNTGEIYDADVEINSENVQLTLSDDQPIYDLSSIVTHEAGHFLGLNHSPIFDATMYRRYTAGDLGMRTLSPDDEAGVCAMYPAGERELGGDCVPRHGFSAECESNSSGGCSWTASPESSSRTSMAFVGLAAVLALAARRRFRTA